MSAKGAADCSLSAVRSTEVVELNVGGVVYATTVATLTTRYPNCLLGLAFTRRLAPAELLRDTAGRCFFDRDGPLFRYILDFLRSKTHFRLPEEFREVNRLRQEAEFYRLPELAAHLAAPAQSGHRLSLPLWSRRSGSGDCTNGQQPLNYDEALGLSPLHLQSITVKEPGYVVVGYRGSFQFGRDGHADVSFRKLTRILVSGRVSLCREIFQDTLNESRDPDLGTSDRYSARFFLKYAFLEQAFDMLQKSGFRLVGSGGSGTNNFRETKPGMDSEETKWNHYNEFVFCRP